jgi:PrcB C-terminal
MKYRHLILPCFLVTLAACDGDVIITDPDGDVPFQTVFSSQSSDIRDERGQLIESQREWDDVWDEIGRGGPPPDVDFSRDDVALVSAGTRPDGCYSIEITRIDVRGGSLRVDADLLEPGIGCVCPDVVVHPVHAVRLRRTGRQADFSIRRVVRDCR